LILAAGPGGNGTKPTITYDRLEKELEKNGKLDYNTRKELEELFEKKAKKGDLELTRFLEAVGLPA